MRDAEDLLSRPRPPRMRRIALRSAIVVTLIIGSTVGVLAGYGYFGSKLSFRPQVKQLLTELGNGPESARAAYNQASPRMRQLVLEEKFIETAQVMTTTLGRFVRVADVQRTQINEGPNDKTGRVEMKLVFENTTTTGSFSFQRRGKEWKLLGMNVVIPPDLQEKAKSLSSREDRIDAQPEVIDKVRAMVTAIREDQLSTIYRDAAQPFRDGVTEQAFKDFIAARKRLFGELLSMLDIYRSGQSPGKKSAWVYAVLAFERTTTKGEFRFARVDGQWRLTSLKIKVPPAFLEQSWWQGSLDAGPSGAAPR